jgi:hypothetical protein
VERVLGIAAQIVDQRRQKGFFEAVAAKHLGGFLVSDGAARGPLALKMSVRVKLQMKSLAKESPQWVTASASVEHRAGCRASSGGKSEAARGNTDDRG